MKFYSLTNILKKKATYNLIIGKRSNGKTYAVLKECLIDFVKNGKQFALIRRWRTDFDEGKAGTMFNMLVQNHEISKMTSGEWSGVMYKSGAWYLIRWEEEKRVQMEKPFAYAFSISASEHIKSNSYPEIGNIVFDEFLTRYSYLPNEFTLYMNLLSTIVRQRTEIRIFMCANTVSKYSPYIEEMGLHNVRSMKKGTIDVYKYGDSRLTVAVEYCEDLKTTDSKGKNNEYLFAFDSPSLKMITSGDWEISLHPHLQPYMYYKRENVKYKFFIKFHEDILQGDIIKKGKMEFIFIHNKTSELKNPDSDLIYSPEIDARPNWNTNIYKSHFAVQRKIVDLINKEKIFFQDNNIGEIMRSYLLTCKSIRG